MLFLSVYPYAFFFGGIMTESLFLLTTAAGLWYIRRHRWWLAGVWGLLAAMTRMHGILLIGAAAAELVEHMGRFDWKTIARRLPALLLPAVGTLIYLTLNWSVTGNPFAFTVMQQHWSQGFCPIADTLWYPELPYGAGAVPDLDPHHCALPGVFCPAGMGTEQIPGYVHPVRLCVPGAQLFFVLAAQRRTLSVLRPALPS